MSENPHWRNPTALFDRLRAILFEPCRTALRGIPWEDVQ